MAAVERRLFGPGVEAAVTAMREAGELGILLLEEVDHGAHRRGEIIKVEPVEARHPLVGALLIVAAQPPDERIDLPVAPHPRRKALEGSKLALARRPVAD